jgi:hypothetical protein
MQPMSEQHDPEQEWRASASSAGQATQRIARTEWDAPTAAPLQPINRRNNWIGLGVLALGLIMLLAQIGGGDGGPLLPPLAPLAPDGPMIGGAINFVPGMILLTIASCMLFFAFWRRIYGLLIPGCLLAGLSAGVALVDLTNGVSILWGLALGFLGIALIGRQLFQQRQLWPVIPAVILFGIGTIMAIAQLPAFFPLGNTLLMFPLLLIGAGLYLGWRRPTA